MKRSGDLKSKAISSSAMVLLVAVSLVFAFISFAWFSNNKDVGSTGWAIKSGGENIIFSKTAKLLKRDTLHGAMDVTDQAQLTLTEFDTVFEDRNVNTPMIIRTVISNLPVEEGEYLPFMMSISTLHPVSDGDWLVERGGRMVLADFLSNIVEVRCAAGTPELDAKTDDNDIYAGAVELLAGTSEQTFVTGLGGNYTKVNSLDFLIENYESTVFMEDGRPCVVVYLEVNYNNALVFDYVEQHNIITEQTHENDIISFDSDIQSFIVRNVDVEEEAE